MDSDRVRFGQMWRLFPAKRTLLRFGIARNPNEESPSFQPTARVDFNRQPALNIFYNGPVNGYCNLNWSNGAVTYRATSAVTRVEFVSTYTANSIAGMYVDTIRMDEVQISTNSLLYATFTDDTLKAFEPIKFAPPPFGDITFVATNKFISGFEGTNSNFSNPLIYTNANLLTNGQSHDRWLVTSNNVYVETNNVFAYSDTNYLLLRTGTIARVLPVVQGKEYVLQFATRASPRRLIFSTGVDDDAVTLPEDSIDPHYFISSNSVTFATNGTAYVLRTTSPPMGTTWINRNSITSRWISVNATTPPPGAARYGFKTKFDLTGYNWRQTILTGFFHADGATVAVRLNGTNVPSAFVTGNNYRTGFVQRAFSKGFIPGINTLEWVLTNAPTPPDNTALGFQAQFHEDAFQFGVITFDDLPTLPITGGGYVTIPNGYAGLQWNNFTAWNGRAQNPGQGIYLGTVSPDNIAYNLNTAAVSSFSRTTPFDLLSAYFTSAFAAPSQLNVQGFVGTTLVYNRNYTLSTTQPTLINFNYRGVTHVRISNTNNLQNTQFVMDNLKLDLTPGFAAPVFTSVGEVKLVGCYTNYFTASSDGWRMQNVTFVARSNNVVLQFAGITPGIWLDHIQLRETGRKYYQAEEPMTPFVGQSAFGNWNLEVWDNRLGALASGANLLSWRLNMNFVQTNPPFVRLANAISPLVWSSGRTASVISPSMCRASGHCDQFPCQPFVAESARSDL